MPASQNYHSMFGLYDITTGYRLNEDLEIHFIEIPKWSALGDKPKKRLERWLAYFSNKVSEEEMEEITMIEPAIQKALQVEQIFLQDEKERYLYEMREKAIRDYESAVFSAEEKGKMEGKMEGKIEGKKETAIRLISLGVPLDTIAEATGLTLVELNLLKEE